MGGGIRIEAQTEDFPPTFSTAFPLVGPRAPCHYERAASAWRGAWRDTRLPSAPPSDAISHGSSRRVSADACQALPGQAGERFHYTNREAAAGAGSSSPATLRPGRLPVEHTESHNQAARTTGEAPTNTDRFMVAMNKTAASSARIRWRETSPQQEFLSLPEAIRPRITAPLIPISSPSRLINDHHSSIRSAAR